MKDAAFYNAVYDLLVSIGGAYEKTKDDFVWHHAEHECDEWRFMGHLGMGGKYRSKTNTVDCYPEDETPERLAIIARLNDALARIEKGTE